MATVNNITAEALIQKFQYALNDHWGYIWGKYGQTWTQKMQNATTNEQAKKYGQKWVGHRVADCSGLFYWAFKELGSYIYHGSNTMYNKYSVRKGALKGGKRVDGKPLKPGTAVYTDHDGNKSHVGLYVGGGKVIEAAGTKSGVITSAVSNSKWKFWGELKYVNYPENTDDPVEESPESPITVTYPTLREGAKGELVVQLQTFLAKDGSNIAIDGIFGSGTRSAVRAFQKRYGLDVDGIVGPKTWTKLLEVAGNIKTSEPVEKFVTLLIPDLKEKEAEELMKKYPRAEKVTAEA